MIDYHSIAAGISDWMVSEGYLVRFRTHNGQYKYNGRPYYSITTLNTSPIVDLEVMVDDPYLEVYVGCAPYLIEYTDPEFFEILKKLIKNTSKERL